MYFPFILLVSKVKNKMVVFSITLITSFIGFFVPINLLLQSIGQILPGFASKGMNYVAELRDAHWAVVFSYFVVIILSLLFFVRNFKMISHTYTKVYLLVLLPVLVTIPFGFLVYDRYMVNFKPLFVLVFFAVTFKSKFIDPVVKLVVKNGLVASFLLYFSYSLYLYRANISGYFDFSNMFLFSIFSKTYTISDIFYL